MQSSQEDQPTATTSDAGDSSCGALDGARRFCRLPLHTGTAQLSVDGELARGRAAFVLPADSGLIVAVQSTSKLTNNMATDLQVTGFHEGRPFTLTAPMCYTRRPGKDLDTGWSLVSPMNRPVTIEYADSGSATQARVILNNFDYDCGDAIITSNAFTRVGTPFAVQLTDRRASFSRRPDYPSVYPLLRAGLFRTASLTDCTFDVLGGTDDDLLMLANDIASLLTIAHGGSVGVAMLELLDGSGQAVRRIVTQPVASKFRDDAIVADFHLPRLFEESFAENVKMRRAARPWHKLPSYCGSLDDMPYIEQKFATLMMALEFFMRMTLLEHGIPEDEVTVLEWNELIGSARAKLGWDIPGHYTRRDVARLVRNAVMHGNEAPITGSAELRLLFNKWRMFLFRRVLIRLGYTGQVISPWKGVQDSSAVADFTEEHNSFGQSESDTHPFVQFVKFLKEHNKGKDYPGVASGSEV